MCNDSFVCRAGRDVAGQKTSQPTRLLPGQHDGLQSLGLPLGNQCGPTTLQQPHRTPPVFLLKTDRYTLIIEAISRNNNNGKILLKHFVFVTKRNKRSLRAFRAKLCVNVMALICAIYVP